MSKIVESMLRVFGGNRRRSKDHDGDRPRRNRKSILAADSFVFLPGEGGTYWGELVSSKYGEGVPVPISHLAVDYSAQCEMRRRTKTVAHVDESALRSEALEVRRRAKSSVDDNMLFGGMKLSRRLSGTLVRAGKTLTDEVEDSSILDHRERWSPDLSGRYVYDRLLRVPTKSQKQPKEDYQKDREKEEKLQQRRSKCVHPERRSLVFEIRSEASGHTYSDLIPLSEYAMPADAIDWEQVRVDTLRGIDLYSCLYAGGN